MYDPNHTVRDLFLHRGLWEASTYVCDQLKLPRVAQCRPGPPEATQSCPELTRAAQSRPVPPRAAQSCPEFIIAKSDYTTLVVESKQDREPFLSIVRASAGKGESFCKSRLKFLLF